MFDLTIKAKYQRGELVRHITDTEPIFYVVTGYLIEGETIKYQCVGTDIRYSHDIELEPCGVLKNKKIKGFNNNQE